MLKKVLSIVLISIFVFGMIPVSARAAGADVTLNKTNYAAKEDIKISISGITQDMVKAKAFIGMYESGAAYNKPITQSVLKAGTSAVIMKAPATKGTYEIRVYQTGAPCLKKVNFTVGAVVSSSSGVVDVALSRKALTYGTWMYINPYGAVYYNFAEDGFYNSFLMFRSSTSSYSSSYNLITYTRGKYQIEGDTLYLTERENASGTGWTREEYGWIIDGMDEARIRLENEPYKPVDDQTYKYEFDASGRLRLEGKSDDTVISTMKFDRDKPYSGKLPTHRLPGMAWPTKKMPANLPPYAKGVLTNYEYQRGEKEYLNYLYQIEHTTPAELDAYIKQLRGLKWNIEIMGTDNPSYTAKKNGFTAEMYFDKYGTLNFTSYPVDTSQKWPSGELPPGMKPPAGCVILEAPDLSYLWDDGSGSFRFECDGVDAAGVKAYFNQLKSEGWVEDKDEYVTHLAKVFDWRGKKCEFKISYYSNGTDQYVSTFNVWITPVED